METPVAKAEQIIERRSRMRYGIGCYTAFARCTNSKSISPSDLLHTCKGGVASR
jgi:hypothetical protein